MEGHIDHLLDGRDTSIRHLCWNLTVGHHISSTSAPMICQGLTVVISLLQKLPILTEVVNQEGPWDMMSRSSGEAQCIKDTFSDLQDRF